MENLKPCLIKVEDGIPRRNLLGRSVPTVKIRSGQVILEPGESIGEHSTKEKEEVIFVLKGEAEVSSDREAPFIAGEDSIIYIPPRVKHNIRNIGAKSLRYVYVAAPL